MKKLLLASLITFFMYSVDYGYAGTPLPTLPPILPGCCQYIINETEQFECNIVGFAGICLQSSDTTFLGRFDEASCDGETGLCEGFVPPPKKENVPTLSEWSLIALTGVLGLIGFMAIRRRMASAGV